jgi:hypothetical protein
MIALVGTLQIINSQAENIKNSIVYGRDPLPGENYDLGWTVAKIVITGSEFGAPIKLRYRCSLISTGNHYGETTIETSTPLTRIYSTGDKFCGDGFITGGPACPNPRFVGPGTVVFATGAPAEVGGGTSDMPEIPNRFGIPVEITAPGNTGRPIFKVTTDDFTNPLMRTGQSSFWYDFKRNYNNGFLEIKGNQTSPHNGIILSGVLQLESIDYAKLVQYGGLSWNGNPVVQNGAMTYCSDCAAHATTGVCISGGTGAFARRLNGVWKCN